MKFSKKIRNLDDLSIEDLESKMLADSTGKNISLESSQESNLSSEIIKRNEEIKDKHSKAQQNKYSETINSLSDIIEESDIFSSANQPKHNGSLQELEIKVKSLQESLTNSDLKLNSMLTENENLKNINNDLLGNNKELEYVVSNVRTSLNESNKDRTNLTNINFNLTNEINNIRQKFHELTKEKEDLSLQLNLGQQTLNQLENKNEKLDFILKEKIAEIGEIKKRNTFLELQIELKQAKHANEIKETELTANNLKKKNIIQADCLEKLNKQNSLILAKNSTLAKKIQDAAGSFLPFCPKLLSWLRSLVTSDKNDPREYSWLAIGNEPFEEGLLDQALSSQGFTMAGSYTEPVNCIITGRDLGSFYKIEDYLEANKQTKPRIYSQELFAVFMLTATDPLEADDDVLIEIGKTHPVMEKLIDIPFEWPNFPSFGNKNKSDELIITGDWDENSPLTAMGYHVGFHSLVTCSKRRKILTKIFKGRLDTMRGFNKSNYDWGLPSSQKRLASIVQHISKNINLRRTNPSMAQAVEEWCDDLKWMKKNFSKKAEKWL